VAAVVGATVVESAGAVEVLEVGASVVGAVVGFPLPPQAAHAKITSAPTPATSFMPARMAGVRVPAAVWRASAELIIALDDRFGEPVDA